MTIIGMIIGFIIILIAVLVFRMKKRAIWQQRKLTLQHLIKIKALIALFQKHRAMCASYLKGEAKSLAVIKTLDQQITPITHSLKSAERISENLRWQGFIDHWLRLEENAINLTVEQSFTQHTDLVANLLYLTEDIAEQEGFDKILFADMPHISMLWRELPVTVECIGQSRALGMAVSTTGVSTQVDKVKLGYLEIKISRLSNQVFEQIQQNKNATSQQKQFVQLAAQACQQLTHTIRTQLVEVNDVSLAPSEYFATASGAMDAINRLLDSELQYLSEQIKYAE